MCRVLCLCHVWTGCSPSSMLLNSVHCLQTCFQCFLPPFLGAAQIPLTLYTGRGSPFTVMDSPMLRFQKLHCLWRMRL